MKIINTRVILIIVTFLQLSAFAQSFRISHVPAQGYSFDKFANEVYYVSCTGIFIKNLNDSTVRNCPFPSLPEFAHNSHLCVYGDGDSIIIYNFYNNDKFLVYGFLEQHIYNYVFSPNDEYLLFYRNYFSFADSSVYPMDYSPDYELLNVWFDETTLLFAGDEYQICSYNFVSNTIDTLFNSNSNFTISTFSYNKENELLYYSLDDNEYPRVYAYNPETHIDSLVFDTENDSGDICWQTFNWFQSMEWSPDNKRMAFFSFILERGGTIYTFNPESGKLFQYTDCGGEGYEEYLKWLNDDTIAYYNATDDYIYGFILDNPLAAKETPREIIPSSFNVSAYPNPFNGTVNINIEGKIKEPEVRIYNINGEEIRRFENLQGFGYQYKQVWNGKNNSNEIVSSGVYFIIVRDKADPLSIKGSSKIIYLK